LGRLNTPTLASLEWGTRQVPEYRADASTTRGYNPGGADDTAFHPIFHLIKDGPLGRLNTPTLASLEWGTRPGARIQSGMGHPARCSNTERMIRRRDRLATGVQPSRFPEVPARIVESCSMAIAPVIRPDRALPDCGGCSATSRCACVRCGH
jgi:hypothetical protein